MKYLVLSIYIIFIFVSCKTKTDMSKQLQQFDESLFPLLVTSYMWHKQNDDWSHTNEWSTDHVIGKKFEWIRFRSSIGETNAASADFCLGLAGQETNISMSLVHIKSGRSCDDSQNEVFAILRDIKRAILKFPKTNNEKLSLEIQWTDSGKWLSKFFHYSVPHFAFNHSSLTWGKTWRNQIPIKDNLNINPEYFLQIKTEAASLSPVKFHLIPHVTSDNWKKAQPCFAVDDNCRPTMSEQCYLCEKGTFTLFNTKCSQRGTTYCGEIHCGTLNQPACYLGHEHIKQADFKDCGPFTEQWYCQDGLEVNCLEGVAICK